MKKTPVITATISRNYLLLGYLAILLLSTHSAFAVANTENDFFQNTSMSSTTNYTLGAPNNSQDILITTTSGPGLTVSGASNATRNFGSLDVTNGLTYTINQSTSSTTNTEFRLGANNTAGQTTAIPGSNPNDVFYISNSSSLTLSETNLGTGSARNIVSLRNSGGVNGVGFNVGAGSTLVIRAEINSTSNLGTPQIYGGGVVTFSGSNSNTYGSAASTTVSAGTLNLQKSGGAIAIPNALVVTGGSVVYGGNDQVADTSNITVNGGNVNVATFNDTVNKITLTSGSITGTSGTLTAAGNVVTVSGSISAILGGATTTLTQSGAGTTILSGANTYGGATSVSAGTLVVNGLQTGTGPVSVSATGVLGGSGTLAGSASVSGVLNPGAGVPTATANLTINDKVIFANGSTFKVNIDAAGNTADKLTIGGLGVLNINGTDTLTFVLANGGALSNLAPGTYTLISFNTRDSTQFNTDGTLQAGWSILYNTDPGGIANQINLVVVPEPATLAMFASGIGMLLGYRRMRRRSGS